MKVADQMYVYSFWFVWTQDVREGGGGGTLGRAV
jgi:hypothetical protein